MGVSEEVIRDMEGGEMIIDNAVNFPEFVKYEIFFFWERKMSSNQDKKVGFPLVDIS